MKTKMLMSIALGFACAQAHAADCEIRHLVNPNEMILVRFPAPPAAPTLVHYLSRSGGDDGGFVDSETLVLRREDQVFAYAGYGGTYLKLKLPRHLGLRTALARCDRQRQGYCENFGMSQETEFVFAMDEMIDQQNGYLKPSVGTFAASRSGASWVGEDFLITYACAQ